ncbi:CHAD domain-containing protein [Streptomyces afghaniensis]|uniref:CHAD domain-containing protein n=1 Tax=Streptomyces afghaniensis TaxID=66865 RepID=UPI0033AB5AB1
MAQQHLDPTGPLAGPAPTGDTLAGYLRAQATEFLRALRLHRETGSGANGAEGSVEAARALRRSARRISASLHTFQSLLDTDWCEGMRPELAWVSGTLAMEHAYTARLERLLSALHRLSGSTALPAEPAGAAEAGVAAGSRAAGAAPVPTRAAPRDAGLRTPPASTTERGNLTVGAAKAGALLDRQLTLARTRAHSTALQALGSSRFHAIADKVAVLASEVPLTPAATTADLRPLATAAKDRLTDAVTALPLVTAGNPYNAAALIHGLSPDTVPHPQDAPWHQVRLLLRLHRYAREAVSGPKANAVVDLRLLSAGQALNRHRDASEAAAAAAQAARTPRIAPATAYALGVLHADQRHEVEAARFAFQQAWQKEAVSTR